jgi:hypothetical protein
MYTVSTIAMFEERYGIGISCLIVSWACYAVAVVKEHKQKKDDDIFKRNIACLR